MNRNTLRIGYFSALGIIILTILYLILLFLPLLIKQEPEWRPAITFYYIIDTSSGFLFDLSGLIFYLRTLLVMALFACFQDYAPNSLKAFSIIALSFIALCAALHTLSYIGQLAIRDFNINACDNECLLYYTHSLPGNYITSVYVMALTVFVGLAELFLIPVFSKTNKIGKSIRLTLLIAGTFNLLSALMFFSGKEGLSASCMLFSLIIFITFILFTLRFFRQFKSKRYEG
jgi:hypothetical protein